MSDIRINVYRAGGEWYGARWIDGEYDGCDALDVEPEASTSDAIAHAQTMPLGVDGERSVARVADTEELP